MHLPAPPAPQVACLPCDVSVFTIFFKSPRYFIVLSLCVREQEEKAPKEEAGSPKVRSFFCCSSRSTKDQEVTCKNHPTKHVHRMHNLDVLKKKKKAITNRNFT